jgi:biotin transport system substrate-specific component
MQIAAKTGTVTEVVFPSVQGMQKVVLAVLFSGLIGLSARLVIPLPLTPVPITGQTFAVLLTGALLGSRVGVLAVLFYLAEGCLGLPVFSAGARGLVHLAGPTGGYLMGFILAAYVVGRLAERGWDRRYSSALAMMLVGELVILALGVVVLARFIPADHVLMAGVWPFLPGDVLKAMLAAALLPTGWKALAKWW